jgi:hypothetical protein
MGHKCTALSANYTTPKYPILGGGRRGKHFEKAGLQFYWEWMKLFNSQEDIIMGQSNSQTLGQEKELLKTYSIESRSKEQNLTFLKHKTSQQSYLLRELIYTEENDFNDMLRRIQQRKEFRNPNLTNLTRTPPPTQNSSTSRRTTSAPSTSASTLSGTTPHRHSPMWSRREHSKRSPSRPLNFAPCWPKSPRAC